LIGKNVRLTVDFIRPREGEFDERECATVRYGGQNSYGNRCDERNVYSHDLLFRNIAEQLIEKGLASVVRHRRDDEDRSPDYDKLMAAEQAYVDNTIPLNLVNSSRSALTEIRGIHSGKEQPAPKQPLNLSEVGCSMTKHIVASFELAV
jgi:staphylococcal nuclease domain-containing protein 1